MKALSLIEKIYWHIKRNLIRISSIVLIPKAIKTAIRCNNIIAENKENVAIIVLTEHIGDIIASQPVSEYLIKNNNKKIIWIVNKKYENIVHLLPSISYILPISCLSEWIYARRLINKNLVYNLHFNGRLCPKYYLKLSNENKEITLDNYYKRGNLLKMFFDLAELPYSDVKPKINLPNKVDNLPDLPKKYFVIHTSSNEICRNWDKKKWILFMNSHPHVEFIEIGLTPTFVNIPNCNSFLCGKTSFADIVYIISKAYGFIGVDSSMAHIANALDCRSIVILGKYKEFESYMPFSGVSDNNFFKVVQREGIIARDITLYELNYVFEKLNNE